METLWMLIGAVILLGVFFVVLPRFTYFFKHYRKKRVIRCPETGMLVEVDLDPYLAACSSPFGTPLLRVKNCTLWPKKKDCDQACLSNVA